MEKFQDFCAKIKVIAAEIASLIFFLWLLYSALMHEVIEHATR